MADYDFLILGSGLAGTVLGFRLQEAGKRVLLVGSPTLSAASRVAAGLCNPLTGPRMVKTWLADTLFPVARNFYAQLGEGFFYPLPIYRPFGNQKAATRWLRKFGEDTEYIPYAEFQKKEFFYQNTWGSLQITQGGFVDTSALLDTLQARLAFRAATVSDEALEISPAGVRWNGLTFGAVIFCRGAADAHSRFWSDLPFDPVKGEILDVQFMKTSWEGILNGTCWVVPHPGQGHRVGATYTRETLDTTPTTTARQQIQERLERLLPQSNYTILQQRAGVRPATQDHRPLIGRHRQHKNLLIFNGFGSKGCTLIPYFSACMRDFLLQDAALDPAVYPYRQN